MGTLIKRHSVLNDLEEKIVCSNGQNEGPTEGRRRETPVYIQKKPVIITSNSREGLLTLEFSRAWESHIRDTGERVPTWRGDGRNNL